MKKIILAFCICACGDDRIVPAQPDPEPEPPAAPMAPEPAPALEPTGDPIDAPVGQWSWVDIPESRCAEGTPTGIAVNLSATSEDVLVYLQGGGACWDGPTCWGLPNGTASHIRGGYGRREFESEGFGMLLLNRGNPDNPFRDLNLVVVPYCTGDIHAGDRVVDYPFLLTRKKTYHHGAKNVGLALERLAGAFPGMRRLVLAGSSAGGFGAGLNLDRAKERFPDARVDVLDDSGQPLDPAFGRWSMLREAWNLNVPADCPECADSIGPLIDYYARKHPAVRFGLVSYSHDAVITGFMALTPWNFSAQLFALADEVDARWPTGRYFILAGASHVALASPTPELIAWLRGFAEDDPGWRSVRPW